MVKFSGNYTPFKQWFYFEAYETIKNLKKPNRFLLNPRYDDKIALYGQEIQEKLSKSNTFNLIFLIITIKAISVEIIIIQSDMAMDSMEERISQI